MNKTLNIIFITLGVIFLLLILAFTLFVIVDPFNLRPLLSTLMSDAPANSANTTEATDKNPLLDANQERILETLGVNVGNLPTEMTPELEACFTEALGAERVKQIIDGDSPSPLDLFKAKACL